MATKVVFAQVVLAACLSGTAAAEIDTSIDIVPGRGAPQLEATIRGAGVQPLEAISLRDPRGVTVPATAVVPFKHGREAISIAFVVEGSEVWLGNDTFEPEDSPARYLGTLNGIRRGFDRLALGSSMPSGSSGMLITYDDRVNVRVPLGPVGRLTGAAFGTQKDYYGRIGQSQAHAISIAVGELERAQATKKLLVVISDGSDTNNEAARGHLADLKKRAAIARIELAAIVYKGYLSSPETVISALTPRTVTVNSYDGIEEAMRDAVLRATSQYTVRFPGEALQWDGKPQELVVQLGFSELDPVTVTMGPARRAPAPWYLSFWAQLVAGVLLVGAIAIGVRVRAGRMTV